MSTTETEELEIKLPIIIEEREIHTKEDVAWAIRQCGEIGEMDMLADLFGASIDNDPLAFMIACDIRFESDMNAHFYHYDPKVTEDMINWYRRKYPNATKRAFALKHMSGDEFYAKYGSKEILRRWETVETNTGIHITDILNLDDCYAHQKSVILAGNDLKNRILWCMAGDWIDNLLHYQEFRLTIAEAAYVCGDE